MPNVACAAQDSRPLADRIASLFVAEVAVSVGCPDETGELFKEELCHIATSVESRRKEFAGGRRCARDALRKLDGPWTALPAARDRRPLWPEGYIGSISHCGDFCCAVAARTYSATSLGIDAEPATALPPEVAEMVCHTDEWRGVSGAPSCGWPKVVFVAKEAFYKAYYQAAYTFLDFSDVRIALRSLDPRTGAGAFQAELVNADRPGPEVARRIVGAWAVWEDKVFAGATLLPTS